MTLRVARRALRGCRCGRVASTRPARAPRGGGTLAALPLSADLRTQPPPRFRSRAASVRPEVHPARARPRSSTLLSSDDPAGQVTQLLRSARAGDADALGRLIPLLYEDLRQLARGHLRREHGERTLQATALVHEAYAKLAAGRLEAEDRGHFFALAARAMRQVLVDEARKRKSGKRGGDWVKTTLSGGESAIDFDPDELLALDEALDDLNERERQVVELRYFAGMEETEVAELLRVSDRTVRREWTKARAKLYKRLYMGGTEPAGGTGDPSERAGRPNA